MIDSSRTHLDILKDSLELIKELNKAKIILQNEMPVKRAVYKALGLFDLNKAKQKFDPDKFGHMLTTV